MHTSIISLLYKNEFHVPNKWFFLVRIHSFQVWVFFQIFIDSELALHRPTYHMSAIISKYPSDRQVDGKVLTGHISQRACTSTLNQKVVPMWIVYLKKPRRIERINVFSRTDNMTWGKKDYTLQNCSWS